MRYLFTRCDTIPRLSWCAHLSRGSRVVHVYHGPWVETRDDWFVEGAWTGPFEQGELDTAQFLVGSGGVIRDGRAIFCTQSDMMEKIYSLRTSADLFLSNSLVFVLAMADDELDPYYPFYYPQLRAYFMDGIHRKRKLIHTGRGQHVQLHEHCQVAVSDDLRPVRVEKPVCPRPTNFSAYVSSLQGVLGGVLENAASPARRHRRYAGLATVSGGYDSNALAALLRPLGVREAITFYDERPGIDSGAGLARRLGMRVHVCGRTDFRTMPGLEEPEFFTFPDKRSDIVLAPFEQQLVGRVLVMGFYGDTVFGDRQSQMLGELRKTHANYGGSRKTEFRLRTGFVDFNPYYAAALHLPAIFEITKSDEMAPWRLGSGYDRPIPRRIIEEAGIPRGTFGVVKRASTYCKFGSPGDLSTAGRADFESYRRSMPRAGVLRRKWHRVLVALRPVCERGLKAIRLVWWTGGKAAESWIPALARFQVWDEMDFLAHWGHARVRPRYAEAKATRHTDAVRSSAATVGHG